MGSLHPCRLSRSLVFGALAGVAALASGADAQVDLLIARLEINQAIQTGNTPLVAGRPTFVRATIAMFDPPAEAVVVDGLMRVFVDGVEAADSPIYSDNGPFAVPTAVDLTDEDATLNFLFIPPESDDVVLVVEVNPPGPNAYPEANTSNNTITSPPQSFGFQRVIELAYAPIDYRPSGGPTPNLPDPALIEPGVGDNFVHGIYPTSDIYYHRIDAPSKLWTSSLSGSGSPLLSSLDADIALMVPEPDFLYGWIPGGLPYNGQSMLPGQVAMGNTQSFRHQRTFAHELGHNHGLSHNFVNGTGVVGVDVEHHLAITELLPQIKLPSLKDIMYPGLFTNEAWVNSDNYNYFYDHPVYDPVAAPGADEPIGDTLLVTGVWNTETGAVELRDVLTVAGARTTPPATPDEADLSVTVWVGGEAVGQRLLRAGMTTDDDSCRDAEDADTATPGSPLAAFGVRLPAAPDGRPVDALSIGQAGARPVTGLAWSRSPAAPHVTVTSPTAAPLESGQLLVTWSATDADGDALRSYLRYSPDGVRFSPLATGLTSQAWQVDLDELPAFVDGQGFFEVLVSDGLNTTVARSAPLTRGASYLGLLNPPWVEILSPDDGTSYLFGATVFLHSSGWDLEDRALDGGKIAWSSDVDGPLGTGRVASVADLSVGTHVITVEATDGDGLTTTDTATVTIVDRDLPTLDDCQTNLGFGGPGNTFLSVCGGELSTGSTADLLLEGAASDALAFFVLGTVNAPTPVKGGTLVPVPFLVMLPLMTDGQGSISIPGIPGGNGPATLYAQFVISDPAQVLGFAFSNALQLEFLP